MSMTEILAEMETLSPEELTIIRQKLNVLSEDSEETPEMLAAWEEGLRSLREEPTLTLEELEKEMRTWTTHSK